VQRCVNQSSESLLCRLQGWRNMESFDNIWKLVGVPVITVQLRYNGWVTEMQVLLLPTSTLTRSHRQCVAIPVPLLFRSAA
jgi:uncharacterized protein with NAD-binding domain and iron-sulfur cluster